MHQSRKEQGMEREARKLLHADFREALVMAGLEAGAEASEEPGLRRPPYRGFNRR